MKTNKKNLSVLLIAATIFLAACKKDEKEPDPVPPPPPSEQELITTFRMTVSDGTLTADYLFKDPDGDGGTPAFYGPGTTTASTQSDSVINLNANTIYTVSFQLFDESKSPAVNISNEIVEEALDHMFFFNQQTPSALPNASVSISNTNLSIHYLDSDSASTALPIGLLTKWTTGNAADKRPLTIELKHQPDVKNGTYAPGDVDISILFKVKIN